MLITFEKILFLKTIPLFDEIPESVLCDIVEQSNEITAFASSDIVKEGDLFDSMYIVMQGLVTVRKNKKIVAEIKQGGIFGEVYAFSPSSSEYTVTVTEDTSLLQISSETAYSLINDYPDVARVFMPAICERLRKATDICL